VWERERERERERDGMKKNRQEVKIKDGGPSISEAGRWLYIHDLFSFI